MVCSTNLVEDSPGSTEIKEIAKAISKHFRAFRASVVKQTLPLRISVAERGSFLLRALECRSAPSIKFAHEKVLAAASRRDGRDGDAGVRVEQTPSQQAPPFQSPPFFASHKLTLPAVARAMPTSGPA
jgi:hypothetical protein